MSRSRATRSKSFPTGITPLPLHDHGNFTIAFPPNRPTAIMASSTDSATTGILSSLTPIVFMRAVAVARWLNARHWSRSPFTGSCSPDAPCRENTSAAYRLQPHGRSAPPPSNGTYHALIPAISHIHCEHSVIIARPQQREQSACLPHSHSCAWRGEATTSIKPKRYIIFRIEPIDIHHLQFSQQNYIISHSATNHFIIYIFTKVARHAELL